MPNKILNIGSNSSLVDVNIPGILTASTPTSSSSNNQVATKEYVDNHTPDLSNYIEKQGTHHTITTNREDGYDFAIQADLSPNSSALTVNADQITAEVHQSSANTILTFDPAEINISLNAETGESNSLSFSAYDITLGEGGINGADGASIRIIPLGGPSGEGEMYIDSSEILQINGTEWGNFPASFITSGTIAAARLPGIQSLTNFSSRVYDATISRTANTVLAAPNGSAGAASFRKLVEADLPTISASKISGTVASATSATTVARATFGDSSNGTHDANAMTSNGLYYYTSNGPATSIGASTTDGAIYCQAYSTSWVGQIAQDYRDGDLFIRGKNNGTWQSWKRIWATGDAVTSAVWNDYAEYREVKTQKPGRCVIENGDDTMSLSTQRLQKGCSITSDTWGFAQGQTEKAKTPIAVSGRVLAYPFEDKEEFRKHIGDAVCSGPEGTVSIMTDEEVQKYPLSIIGTISAVPEYEEWGGGSDRDPVKVNGRVWIRIK